jgi:hypothetical protein
MNGHQPLPGSIISAHITNLNRRAESLMGRFAAGFANRAAFLGKVFVGRNRL